MLSKGVVPGLEAGRGLGKASVNRCSRLAVRSVDIGDSPVKLAPGWPRLVSATMAMTTGMVEDLRAGDPRVEEGGHPCRPRRRIAQGSNYQMRRGSTSLSNDRDNPPPNSKRSAAVWRSGYREVSLQRAPHAQAFNSFFSSLRKRQSVCLAMSLFGLDLIRPAWCIRSA